MTLGTIAATVAGFVVYLAVPEWAEANRQAYRAIEVALFLLAGGVMGSVVVGRVRREDGLSGGSRWTVAGWLGLGLAVGYFAGATFTDGMPWGRRAKSGMPVFITLVIGSGAAWMAATRAGFTPAAQQAEPPPPPAALSDADLAAVREGLAMLDYEDATLARLWSGALFAHAPTQDETNAVFAEFAPYSALCAKVPKGHPVLIPMLEAAVAYGTAMQLRFIARGWEEVLGLGPGAPDYVRQLAEKFNAPTGEAGQVADVAWREARHQRNAAADIARLPHNAYP